MNDDAKKHLKHLTHLCSRSEKSLYDIYRYFQKHTLDKSSIEEIIAYLQQHGYIDEARYAKAFVHDAFYLNRWGRLKIRYYLQQKQIAQQYIDDALETEINESDYIETLKQLLTQKKQLLKDVKTQLQKQKIINFALSKGFEPDLTINVLKSLKIN